MSEFRQEVAVHRVRWYQEVRVKGNLESALLFTGVTLA